MVAYQGDDVLGGSEISFDSLLGQGTPVILNFWAAQCPPCLAEMPWFQGGVSAECGRRAAGSLNLLVDRVAGESGGFVGGLLPLGFAFGAGMASAFNPCGFPLLPTYLGLFLSEGDPEAYPGPSARLARAVAVGGTVTVGFVLLFIAAGVTIGVGARVLVDWLPWIAVGLGVALVLAGGYLLAGGSIYSTLPGRLSARFGAGAHGVRGYLLFGLAYGLASLSCTLPIFLAAVGASITTATAWTSLGALLLYGLGWAPSSRR